MSKPEQKLVQYLMEARASESALVRVLQSQIAMTPRGSYRSALESHLAETRRHARRVGERVRTLDPGFSPVTTAVGLWENVFGQTLALGKAPLDLLRGTSGEEKVLKNAKDTCATESLEIATYTAIEQVARRVGDRQTADLAADILRDEQRMLDRVMRELPRLADAVVGAEIEDEPTYDVSETGAADAARATATKLDDAARDAAHEARNAPAVAQAEARINQTVRDREPWPGYDKHTVADVRARLKNADEAGVRAVREYERAHKNRAGVLRAAERQLTA